MNTVISKSEIKRMWSLVLPIFFGIVIFDQWTKIYVKTHFRLGQSHHITDWWQIVFHENNGMAFSIEMGDKIFLTLFRVIAVGLLSYFIYASIRKGYNKGFIIGFTMVVAGAVGNIIDCLFYGVLFGPSVGQVAEFLPESGGYGSFMYGKVVDMLYFPLIQSYYPDWMPFVGGDKFTFFSPVFNVADSFVCIGVFYLVIFQHKALKVAFEDDEDKKKDDKDQSDKKEEQ